MTGYWEAVPHLTNKSPSYAYVCTLFPQVLAIYVPQVVSIVVLCLHHSPS